jgi:hypothetical protein
MMVSGACLVLLAVPLLLAFSNKKVCKGYSLMEQNIKAKVIIS